MTSPLQRKLKIIGPVIVTANRLGDGAVIYRTGAGQWTTQLELAAVATSASAAEALLTTAVADDIGAVGAYVAPVQIDAEGHVRPGNLRESIRQIGPSFDLPGTFGI